MKWKTHEQLLKEMYNELQNVPLTPETREMLLERFDDKLYRYDQRLPEHLVEFYTCWRHTYYDNLHPDNLLPSNKYIGCP